jgi:uncharacterized coiled-coil DUF342 family protein
MLSIDLRETKARFLDAKNKVIELQERLESREAALRKANRSSGQPVSPEPSEVDSLRRRIVSLSGQLDTLREEFQSCEASLTAAFSDLGLSRKANQTLTGQVQELIRSSEETTRSLTKQIAELRLRQESDADTAARREYQLTEQLKEAQARVADGNWWQGEAKRQADEMEQAQLALREALSSVQVMKNDKRQLADQIRSLVSQYMSAETALDHTSKELVAVTSALQHSTEEMNRRSETARKDRVVLVRAALESLQQLRSHLTFTLSGLRVVQQKGDDASLPWKEAAGIIHADGDAMVVQFVPPLHNAIDHRRAGAVTAFTRSPVQVSPAEAPTEPWFSDEPANPLWPTKRMDGRSNELHRWGATPKPPGHARSGRTAIRHGRTPRAQTARPAIKLPTSAELLDRKRRLTTRCDMGLNTHPGTPLAPQYERPPSHPLSEVRPLSMPAKIPGSYFGGTRDFGASEDDGSFSGSLALGD